MSDGLENAAAAFAGEIKTGGKSPSSSSGPERFTVREMEDDDAQVEEAEGVVDGDGAGDDSDGVLDSHPDDQEGLEEGEDPGAEDGVDDEGEEGEGKEVEAGELSPDTKIEVIVDGQPQVVTLKEATEGYIRTATFHKRMNEVHELDKVVKAQGRVLVEDRTEAIALVERLQKELNALVPAEPDWDKLFAEDPAKARNLQKQYDGIRAARADLEKLERTTKAKLAEDQAKVLQQYAADEARLFVSTNKDLQDRKVLEKELVSMKKTALSAGFTEDEINTVYDHRMLTLLRKASKYDRMMAAKPKPVNPVVKSMSPGNANRSAVPKERAKASQRLRKSGSLEDAAGVFQTLLD